MPVGLILRNAAAKLDSANDRFAAKLRTLPPRLSERIAATRNKVLGLEASFLFFVGTTLISIGEFAAAVALFVLLGFLLLLKALTLSKSDGAPRWVLRIVCSALALGFCLALVLIAKARKPMGAPWANLETFFAGASPAAPSVPIASTSTKKKRSIILARAGARLSSTRIPARRPAAPPYGPEVTKELLALYQHEDHFLLPDVGSADYRDGTGPAGAVFRVGSAFAAAIMPPMAMRAPRPTYEAHPVTLAISAAEASLEAFISGFFDQSVVDRFEEFGVSDFPPKAPSRGPTEAGVELVERHLETGAEWVESFSELLTKTTNQSELRIVAQTSPRADVYFLDADHLLGSEHIWHQQIRLREDALERGNGPG